MILQVKFCWYFLSMKNNFSDSNLEYTYVLYIFWYIFDNIMYYLDQLTCILVNLERLADLGIVIEMNFLATTCETFHSFRIDIVCKKQSCKPWFSRPVQNTRHLQYKYKRVKVSVLKSFKKITCHMGFIICSFHS